MKTETLYPVLNKLFSKGFKNYSAEEIKSIRSDLGLSQEKFGQKFFACKSTIKKWENGTRLPSCSSMRLLQFLEIMAEEKNQNINCRIRKAYK